MSEPHILLSGKTLALAMPRADMLPEYHKWENDPATITGYGNQWAQAWEVRAAGYERQRGNQRFQQFEVVRLADNRPVGMTILEVNPHARTAEFVIVLAPDERGKGHATESTRLTLDWAFHVAALRMVWLKVLEPNQAGIAAYKKAGFHESGRLRKAGFWLGEPVDELFMDALPEDVPGLSAVRAALGA
ncbi:GNAT family N-acetyltransferase [Streptomyces sp. NPDC056347]|uniref:GNAT family N-acetyltransferase n=1 Tax=Streptomyces sp. NPDC056347 TaxID=3345790 RepID=UPI0035DF794A